MTKKKKPISKMSVGELRRVADLAMNAPGVPEPPPPEDVPGIPTPFMLSEGALAIYLHERARDDYAKYECEDKKIDLPAFRKEAARKAALEARLLWAEIEQECRNARAEKEARPPVLLDKVQEPASEPAAIREACGHCGRDSQNCQCACFCFPGRDIYGKCLACGFSIHKLEPSGRCYACEAANNVKDVHTPEQRAYRFIQAAARLHEENKKLARDVEDMKNAPGRSRFERCSCGHMADVQLRCPYCGKDQ